MIREREDLEKGLGQWAGDKFAGWQAGRQYGKLDPTQQGEVDAQMAEITRQKNENLPPDQQMAIPQGKQGFQNMTVAARKGERSEKQANQMIGQLQQAAGGQQAQGGQQQAAGGQQGGGNNAYAQQHAQLLAQQAQGQPKAQGGMGYNPMTMLVTGGLSAIAQAGKNYFTNRQNQQKQGQALRELGQLSQQPPQQQQQAPAPAGAPAPPAPAPAPAPAPPAPAPPAPAGAPAGVPVPASPAPDPEEEHLSQLMSPKSEPFWNTDMLDSADRIYKGMDYLRYRK